MAPVELLAMGLIATLLALLRLYTWTAVGVSLRAARFTGGSATRTGVAMLAGACVTMVVYATLSAAGMLGGAVAIDAAIGGWALVRHRGDARREAGRLLRECAALVVPQPRDARVALAGVVLLLWVVAIGPPRDGDVMHYHLAHIRQIVASGVWRQLPICSYGIPFGWSLTYLPFEWAGIPQTAHLLNFGAWAIVSALCIETASTIGNGGRPANATMARWLLLGATLLPLVMKSATTAMADAFTMFSVALALALLAAWPRLEQAGSFALGFAAFAALSTRYQAAAVAIAITAIVVFEAMREPAHRRLLWGYCAGAAVACVAASPFYIANAITLGSPLWPFGAAAVGGHVGIVNPLVSSEFAELATRCASRALSGGWNARIAELGRLVVNRTAFPIPLVFLVGGATAVVRGPVALRRVGIFIFLFVTIWAIAQPQLEPRFAGYLVFAAIVCAAPLGSSLLGGRFAPVARVAGGVSIGALSMVAIVYSADYLKLAATGDVARFHRATWYWPAYDWANRNTAQRARFVVVLYGGDTYALDRWNLSGDPGSSAAVPWGRISTGCDLGEFLLRARADFVFYGPNVWTGEPLDAGIAKVVTDATAAGALTEVRRFDVPIVYGRMEGLERRATVTLFAVDSARDRAACSDRRPRADARGSEGTESGSAASVAVR